MYNNAGLDDNLSNNISWRNINNKTKCARE